MKKTILGICLAAACAASGGELSFETTACAKCPARLRIAPDGLTATINLARLKDDAPDDATLARRVEALKARARRLVDATRQSGDSRLRPLMGWSSWNTFGVDISEAIILETARAMATNGLKAAGYTYVNIDDGFFWGHGPDGRLRFHPRRFPNGMKPTVDGIHALGLKAGIYSDAGANTCGSMWAGSGTEGKDNGGVGGGLYGHDADDCRLHFNELGFDFIKVDYCGAGALRLDECTRYTEIANAIRATGRTDVRLNLCRWAFPGTWAARIADSWRTTEDIRANWKSVRKLIGENLYLGAYASPGHYNDMDMLEVGQRKGAVKSIFGKHGDTGLSEDEEVTHFGMWCMMSSPLLIGCDVRTIPAFTKALITNPFLIALNQNRGLGVQGQVAWRDGEAYAIVKDAETRFGTSRYVALYNAGDAERTVDLNVADLGLGGAVEAFDLVERADYGEVGGRLALRLRAHASRFFRLDAATRLEQSVYEAEAAYLPAYQELCDAAKAGTAAPHPAADASGGVVVRTLGNRPDNGIEWKDVFIVGGGPRELKFFYSSPDDRAMNVSVDGHPVATLAVRAAKGYGNVVSVAVTLAAGPHEIALGNPNGPMPEIDLMRVERPAETVRKPLATLWTKGDFAGAHGTRLVRGAEGDELVLPRPGTGLRRVFTLKPEWRVLTLRGEMRVTDVPTGAESWNNGRFALRWTDAKGRTVQPWPDNIGESGTTDWRAHERAYVVPKGAARLEMCLCNLSTGGEVRFRNVSLEVTRARAAKPGNAPLPDGAGRDPESLDGAWAVSTPTRLRLSLNGLWRCRPALADDPAGTVPGVDDGWGWGVVPDVWKERHGFEAVAALSPYFEDNPERTEGKIRPLRAWYERTFVVPRAAEGRRVAMTFALVASRAVVYVDGARVGEVKYPNGEVDLTAFLKPGARQRVSLDVTAFPEGETLDYNESTRAAKVAADVRNKGLTGDVWLDLAPKGARVDDAWAETSVEKGEIRFVAETTGGAPRACRLRAEVRPLFAGGAVRTFGGAATPDAEGRLAFAASWPDAALWDVDTPWHRYVCRLTLLDAKGAALDAALPFEFGFREVLIRGRDLYLNGSRLHLRALYDGSISHGRATGSEANAVRLCRNVLAHGFNFMIAGNYNCRAGSLHDPEGILGACDKTGLLYSFTMPHFKDFATLSDPAAAARYRDTARRLMRLARRHPSVLFYATSHNAAGYLGAGKPQRIDGLYELPPSANGHNRDEARAAEKILRGLDATRPVYHHESGNLGAWHCFNCYLDWAPVQERNDWPEHWATVGVKPLFFVEWGLPHISTWSSYRGPLFIWRGTGYMSLWASEFAAAFRGDAAYEATPEAFRALDREEALWAAGRPFSWSTLNGPLNALTNNYQGVQALYADENWRNFRGWGVTAMLPWDQNVFFRRVRGGRGVEPVDRFAKTPGWKTPLVSQWADPRDCALTAVGAALTRWNRADCAWIGGGDVFTTRRRHYRPGEEVRKTLMIVNDRRRAVRVGWSASMGAQTRRGAVVVGPGDQARVPVAFAAPEAVGRHALEATFAFADAPALTDAFEIDVCGPAPTPKADLAVYDPAGVTASNLRRLGFAVRCLASPREFAPTAANARTRLVIGREALTREIFTDVVTPFAWAGGQTVVFEQTKRTLEDLGFRVQEYALRRAFARFRKPGLDAAVTDSRLRDWAGESTLTAPFDPPRAVETGAGQSASWAGFEAQARVWRCGNRGAIASVIPEKPSFGDWRALVDGGFDLQYAPLLEERLGRGGVTFCQLDVTGRTVGDPAADDIVRAVFASLGDATPQTSAARPLGSRAYAIGRQPRDFWFLQQDEKAEVRGRFLVTPGAGAPPEGFFEAVTNGATALLLGLSAEEVRAWCPFRVAVADVKGRHFSRLERLPTELNGLSNADWAWHGKMDFAAFTGSRGEGHDSLRVFRVGKGRLVFWQVPPWAIDADAKPYLRTSRRRAEAMLTRLLANLGFKVWTDRVRYADVPEAGDDPYRYYHW